MVGHGPHYSQLTSTGEPMSTPRVWLGTASVYLSTLQVTTGNPSHTDFNILGDLLAPSSEF